IPKANRNRPPLSPVHWDRHKSRNESEQSKNRTPSPLMGEGWDGGGNVNGPSPPPPRPSPTTGGGGILNCSPNPRCVDANAAVAEGGEVGRTARPQRAARKHPLKRSCDRPSRFGISRRSLRR